jgi:hypothetical protein
VVTLIVTLALVAAPAESVTLKVIVYGPAALYEWLPVQVPAPLVSLTVPVELEPSPHVIVQVWVSSVPASPNEAFAVTDVPVWKELLGVGEVTETVGATLATVTRKVPVLVRPVAS